MVLSKIQNMHKFRSRQVKGSHNWNDISVDLAYAVQHPSENYMVALTLKIITLSHFSLFF